MPYRRVPCKSFKAYACCKYGGSCTFKHGDAPEEEYQAHAWKYYKWTQMCEPTEERPCVGELCNYAHNAEQLAEGCIASQHGPNGFHPKKALTVQMSPTLSAQISALDDAQEVQKAPNAPKKAQKASKKPTFANVVSAGGSPAKKLIFEDVRNHLVLAIAGMDALSLDKETWGDAAFKL